MVRRVIDNDTPMYFYYYYHFCHLLKFVRVLTYIQNKWDTDTYTDDDNIR